MERLRSKTAIELDSGLVPVEHGPLESAAIPLDGQAREMDEQALSHAMTPPFGFHEQVLQIETTPAEERREIVKEQRETGGFAAGKRNHHLRIRPRPEQCVAEPGFGGDHLVRELLVVAKRLDELQHERNVVGRRGANRDVHANKINQFRREPVYFLDDDLAQIRSAHAVPDAS